MDISKIAVTITKVLFLVFATIFIIQITLKFTGHSPTELQLLYIVIGLLATQLFVMTYKWGLFIGEIKSYKLGGFIREVRDFMSTTRYNFDKLEKK